MHGDGGRLCLRVGLTGAKSWILRIVVHGKRRELGLGSALLDSLAEVREKARALRCAAREGSDPDAVRKLSKLTFWLAAETVHSQLRQTWKNAKAAASWLQGVRTYAKSHIGDRPSRR